MRNVMLAAVSLAAATAWAQPAIAPPQVGFAADPAGSFRPVYGLAGNFIWGDPAATGVVAAAFSYSFGLLKTDSSVIVTDRLGQAIASTNAPQGRARFAFSSDGQPALVLLPDSNTILQWTGAAFSQVSFDPSAVGAKAILSIAAPDSDHAALLIQRDEGLWNVRVLLSTGGVDSQIALPGLAAPAFLLADGTVVSSDTAGLVLQRPDGSQIHIPAQLPDRYWLQQMASDWLVLRDASSARQFAVRLTPHREAVYSLPEVNQ